MTERHQWISFLPDFFKVIADMNSARLFAVVPAAGHSRRMGRPKLLLPLGTGTVISGMLAVLQRPEITATLVVVRPDDTALREVVASSGATVLQPDGSPPEMRDSVEFALRQIETDYEPGPDDGWMLIPADHPLLDATILDRMIAAWRLERDRILVPVHGARRGHPTIFPFRLAREVYDLPPERGLNFLLRKDPARIREVEVESPSVLADLDTPEDYARLQP
jgi:molybdenum cofactor cytidylyltransferase